jgi:nucleoside-diphosphate-sugar epimerase
MQDQISLPESIESEEALDEILSRPRPVLVEMIARVRSPLVVLGASGKMGPSLALLARRAARAARSDLKVVAVARFSDPAQRDWLENHGVETHAADLLDRSSVDALPDAGDIIYMAGRKFGTADSPELTWAMNTLPPEYVMSRYRGSRVVAMSTGCVYPLVAAESNGSREEDPLEPLGEYSNACVARERVFEYCSRRYRIPVALIRLNYALDLRYGVLVDIATRVYRGEPVDLSMGFLNCIWQGDANEMIIRSIEAAAVPPVALNLTGAEKVSVRAIASRFAELFGKPASFTGVEAGTALLSDASRTLERFGPPAVSLDRVVGWTAGWIAREGRLLGKPTHYEVSDGRY